MSAASLAKPFRQRALWVSLPLKLRTLFVRLRGRFSVVRGCSWAFTGQPEHLLAYASWSEIACDDEQAVVAGDLNARGQIADMPDARRSQ
jgi:hypothetical protein